jgi:hypothetical protein
MLKIIGRQSGVLAQPVSMLLNFLVLMEYLMSLAIVLLVFAGIARRNATVQWTVTL